MDSALNNLQRLICHKTQQTKPNQNLSIIIIAHTKIILIKHFCIKTKKEKIWVETHWPINKPANVFALRFTFSTHTHTQTQTYIYIYIYINQIHTHTRTNGVLNARAHIHTRTHTRTHTCTYFESIPCPL